jgi:hypothetical protein
MVQVGRLDDCFTAQVTAEPLPLAINVIDMAVCLYAHIYAHVPNKHRLQMFDHFNECLRTAQKNAARQQAVGSIDFAMHTHSGLVQIQLNIYAALACALKSLNENKCRLDGEPVQKAAVNLLAPHLGHANPLVRVAAADCLGRLAQAVGDAQFVAGMAQFAFDKYGCFLVLVS